ncbi:MAG: EAL domain-containing protein [Comamonadaceae bacterium]|nr:MAG: EAL domain-containing protein [Comamonadaceae bacterium]
MQTPPALAHAVRLEALHSCGILNTPPEEAFNQLTRLAAHLCGMPMAAIGFLSGDEEWFKASVGLPLPALDGAHPLCSLAADGQLVVVEDASAHAAIKTHPLVTGAPQVRSLACMPLVTAEHVVLGAVVVMDTRAHGLPALQRESLRAVADQVVALLELRRRQRSVVRLTSERDHMIERLRTAGRIARVGGWQVDLPSRVLTWSAEVAGTYQLPSLTAPLETALDIYAANDRQRVQAAVETCAREGTPFDIEATAVMPDTRSYRVRVAGHPVHDAHGRIVQLQGAFQDVSDSHAARTARSESDERFHLVTRATADAIWDWNLQTDSMWWNDGMQTLFGIPMDTLPADSTSWTLRLHPEDSDGVLESIHAVIDGTQDFWTESYRFRRYDDSYAWVQDRGFVIRDAQGRAHRMVGGMTDISAQKEAELEAHHEARTHAELVRVQQKISSLDRPLDGVLQLAAATAHRLTQADAAVVELRSGAALHIQGSSGGVPDLERGTATALAGHPLWQRLAAGHTVTSCDLPPGSAPGATGLPGCETFIAAPLRAGDEVMGVIKVMSQRQGAFSARNTVHLQILADSLGATLQLRQVDAQLRASERQYRALFADHPQPMWVYASTGLRILAVNRAMAEHYGYTEAELLGMNMRDLWLAQEREQLAAEAEAALHHERCSAMHVRHLRKDGTVIDMEISVGGTQFNGVAARQVLASDITQRLRMERELSRVGRAQRLLSACNETIVRAASRADLLHAICRIAVEIGGYRMGWVGMACDDAHRTIEPVAHAGHNDGYLQSLQLSWSADEPAGRGPAGVAIRSGKTVIVRDIRRSAAFADRIEQMLQHGFHAVICLPLRNTERTFAVLYLYAPEVLHISAEETQLLEELATDMAFGLETLRVREKQERLQATVLKVAAAVSAGTGSEFFGTLAHNMADALGAQAAGVARLLPADTGEPERAVTLSRILNGQTQPNSEYVLHGTPGQALVAQRQLVITDGALQAFPTAQLLQMAQARSYVGQQLTSSDGQPIGLIFVMFRTALQDSEFVINTLQIFAARATAEIERQTADMRIRRQASLLDKARDAIIVRDLDHRILFWNQGAERMYGFTQSEAQGQFISRLLYKDPQEFHRATQTTLEQGEWNGEITQYHAQGHAMEVEGRWTLVRGDDGQPESILAINSDIAHRKATEREIQRLAFYDPLTGLPNRMLLMDRMAHALANAQRRHQGGALLFIDLDNFKTLNDTLGHDKGDLLLQQVAERLNTCVRAVDTVARLGGDEFVVMVEELSLVPEELALHARTVGDKVLAVLAAPYALAGYQYRSTPSIGIAPFSDAPTSVGELLKQADLAMYQAKTAGRNTLRFFDPGMQAVVTARAALESDLRAALVQDEFLLHYQPQTDDAGQVVGVEALLRWAHPTRGMVSPAQFIPLAEETGLVLSLGRWVLHTACKTLAGWQDDPARAHLTMAVNVSSRQFRHAGFVDDVARVLAITGAPSGLLKLELTESLLVEDMETTIATMAALRSYGVGFSLDDFGTGYSSLSYLKRMPLDQLKIDQSFVRDLLTDPNDAAIVDTIIGLSRSLGLEVIAEGVETVEQRDWLLRAGCRFYQGYLFSRPVALDQLERYLENCLESRLSDVAAHTPSTPS